MSDLKADITLKQPVNGVSRFTFDIVIADDMDRNFVLAKNKVHKQYAKFPFHNILGIVWHDQVDAMNLSEPNSLVKIDTITYQ